MAKKKKKTNKHFVHFFPNKAKANIRNLLLGDSIQKLEKQEGEDFDELEEGDNLVRLYYLELDDGCLIDLEFEFDPDKHLVSINLFFRFNLYDHGQDQSLFDELVDQIYTTLKNEYGKPIKKVVERKNKDETFFIWELAKLPKPQRFYLVSYLKEHPEDFTYNEMVLKIEQSYLQEEETLYTHNSNN